MPHPSNVRVIILSVLVLCAPTTWADTYRLTIDEQGISLTGEKQTAITANGVSPAPTLHWREGEIVNLQVSNRLKTETSLHWHGIILPYEMDGVPGISFHGIGAGQTFNYQFKVQQSGTYWYHGHSGFQEQQGLYGALIIDPPHNHHPADRDYAILLADWPEDRPERIMARLKKQSDYYNFQKRTVGDFFSDAREKGFFETLADRMEWGEMRMEPTDLADVTGATYHYLINGATPDMNWSGLFAAGETVRLRFINASAMTHFDVRIPGLKMQVIAADGQDVDPVAVDEFRIAVAETYDVLVTPEQPQAYAIFAEAMDRSGYASASLTPKIGLRATPPGMTPRTLLTMADMGMPASGGHQHDHAAATEMPVENEHAGHAQHQQHNADDAPAHSMHDHQAMLRQQAEASNAHKTLSYPDLRASQPDTGWRAPDREIKLRLTGNMHRYMWSFDDIAYADADPIRLRLGERVRFTYVNETMMNHPIHMHGLWQYLDNGNGEYSPKKHVINVKPGTTASVVVPADAVGEWAFHCHLMYHMDAGMFRKIIITAGPKP